MPAPPPTLKSRALRLLSLREHSRVELQSKLQPFASADGALSSLLDDLQAKGLINEQRVLESVLHRRAARLGGARIRHELQVKGLAPQAVAQALAELGPTELARAREVWRKKFGVAAADTAQRGKQMRFLAGRGFDADTIRRVLSGDSDNGA